MLIELHLSHHVCWQKKFKPFGTNLYILAPTIPEKNEAHDKLNICPARPSVLGQTDGGLAGAGQSVTKEEESMYPKTVVCSTNKDDLLSSQQTHLNLKFMLDLTEIKTRVHRIMGWKVSEGK